MCLLVIMCALALIRTGSGAVIVSDNTAVDSGDNSEPGDACFHECVPRCQQLVKIRCCNCISLCEQSCDTSFQTISNRLPQGSKSPPQWTLCANSVCDLPDVAERRPVVPRRTKRRPSRSPMLREAAIIARSVGLDLGPLDAGAEDNDVGDSVGDGRQVIPRLVSLVPGEESVTAVVSWDPLATPGLPAGTPWYLVTWEPEGGGVRGNLLANSTSASLTLWPDTVYHIQVSSSGSTAASGCLEVDTRSSSPPQLAQGATRGFALFRREELSGVAASVLLFLVILVVSAWRRRNRPDLSKTIGQSHQDCDLFKLYPPPVTLRRLADERRTTQQLPA